MSAETDVRPDVASFVTRVRELLADLPADVRQELTEGLEADLTDQVAERDGGSLGDPEAYVRELRSAAGFDPEPRPVPTRVPAGIRVTGWLDGARGRWLRLVDELPGDPWGLVVTLRPAWWMVRAWLALELVDLLWGSGSYNFGLSVIPSLRGAGLPLLLIATLVSVQIGRQKLWPGTGGLAGRLVLLALNLLAVAVTPVCFGSVATPADVAMYANGTYDGYDQGDADAAGIHDLQGLYADGHRVSQIYPYDAAGKPLVGVQLFDQTGKPVDLSSSTECVYDAHGDPVDKGRVYYPWSNGAAQVRNVFPVPSVVAGPGVPDPDPQAFSRRVKPTIGQFPSLRVPAVSLPGLKASVGHTPKGALAPGVRPRLPINPIDGGC